MTDSKSDPAPPGRRPSAASGPPSVAVWLTTGLGLGLISPAPGTVGSAVWGLPLAWAMGHLPGIAWQLPAILALCAVGIPLATAAGRTLGGEKDNQAIIWDEIVTVPLVFLFVPITNWRISVAGFALHRLFDITKPPPARQLERLPEGLGVMADDFMASIYACASLAGLAWLDQTSAWHLMSPAG